MSTVTNLDPNTNEPIKEPLPSAVEARKKAALGFRREILTAMDHYINKGYAKLEMGVDNFNEDIVSDFIKELEAAGYKTKLERIVHKGLKAARILTIEF